MPIVVSVPGTNLETSNTGFFFQIMCTLASELLHFLAVLTAHPHTHAFGNIVPWTSFGQPRFVTVLVCSNSARLWSIGGSSILVLQPLARGCVMTEVVLLMTKFRMSPR